MCRFELSAIVSFQFELSANLSCQEPEDEGVFPPSFELKRAFLRQGYGFRRGRVTSKVTLFVTSPIVCPLRIYYASKSARTDFASSSSPLQETFAHQVETLLSSYKEARRAPHTNSNQLLHHEKKDPGRLEKTTVMKMWGGPGMKR